MRARKHLHHALPEQRRCAVGHPATAHCVLVSKSRTAEEVETAEQTEFFQKSSLFEVLIHFFGSLRRDSLHTIGQGRKRAMAAVYGSMEDSVSPTGFLLCCVRHWVCL